MTGRGGGRRPGSGKATGVRSARSAGASARAGGTSRQPTVKLKTARGRTASSQRWLERQLNDPYVVESKRLGYRSRAAFKLLQLDEKFQLLKPGARVLDLGAAPGGWTQVSVAKVGAPSRGRVVGLDILPVEPIAGAILLEADFTEDAARHALTSPRQQTEQDSLTHPTVGDPQTQHRPQPADRLQNRASGHHQIGALLANTRMCRSLLKILTRQMPSNRHGFRNVEEHTVDLVAYITREVQPDTGQGGHGARSADHLYPPSRDLIRDGMLGLERCQRLGHLDDHRFIGAVTIAVAAMPLGQCDHANRHGRGIDLATRGARPRPGKLGRAAADVEHQGSGHLRDQQRPTSGQRQIGFLTG